MYPPLLPCILSKQILTTTLLDVFVAICVETLRVNTNHYALQTNPNIPNLAIPNLT